MVRNCLKKTPGAAGRKYRETGKAVPKLQFFEQLL
jgi:hypothetical protein